MESVFKTRDFQRLKQQWYQKLKSTGFKDIEHSSGVCNSHLPDKDFESHAQFFRYMGFMAEDDRIFFTQREQDIVRSYADGKTMTEISVIVKKTFGEYYSLRDIHKVISAYRSKLKDIARDGQLEHLKEGIYCMITAVSFGMPVEVGGQTRNSVRVAKGPSGGFKIELKNWSMPDGSKLQYLRITPPDKTKTPTNVFITNVKQWEVDLDSDEELDKTLAPKKNLKTSRPGAISLNVADAAV